MVKNQPWIRILFCFYALTLTWLLLRKSGKRDLTLLDIDFGFLYNDKVTHTFAFLLLTLLGVYAFPKVKPLFFVVIFTAYGVLIEFLQEYMALGRSFEYTDMLSDFTGCLLALIIIRIM